jgi:hypothetical protein
MQMNFHKSIFRATAAAILLIIALAGCAAPPAPEAAPPSGQIWVRPGSFQVREYALVEQSADNPTHAGFQARVPEAVSSKRAGFWRARPATEAPNRVLAPFNYRLAANPTPPFSGYALYHGETLVQRDIARFWAVSARDKHDFTISLETFNGERLTASAAGVEPVLVSGGERSPLAYTGAGNVGSTILSGQTSDEVPWAIELDGSLYVDGHDLNAERGYERSFFWKSLDGQPFYFFTRGGLTRIHYASSDQPYIYDEVVYDRQGETSVFNPGSHGDVLWFYALRDGLWYYVEAGVFR